MKRIIRLTESDLIKIVNKVIREQIQPETLDFVKAEGEFMKKFQGKEMNFYLPGDNSLPIISKFMCNKVSFNGDSTEIYFFCNFF